MCIRLPIVVLFFAVATAPAAGQEVLEVVDGFLGGDNRILSKGPDVDQDGFRDLLVGGSGTTIEVRSGKDGSVLGTIDNPTPGSGNLYGRDAATVGDLNGDGVAEIAVGSPGTTEVGYVRVHSGATLGLLRTLTGEGGTFGRYVSGFGDMDGDGVRDIAVAETGFDDGVLINAGRVQVFSVVSGSLLAEKRGTTSNAFLGVSLCAVGDVDGDGTGDLGLGAPGADDADGSPTGVAAVLSGRDLSSLWTFEGALSHSQFGFSVDGAGDTDGDGVNDLVVGAPMDGSIHGQPGSASLYSGADGQRVWQFLGPQDAVDLDLGRVVAAAGDIDADGLRDVIVGSNAATHVLAGTDGHEFFRMDLPATANWRPVAFLGDIDLDGHADFAYAPVEAGDQAVRMISGRAPTLRYELPFGGSALDGPANFGSVPGEEGIDQRPDFVVGQADSSLAWLVSGPDGTVLREFVGDPGSSFGSAVAVLDDIDGDGLDDVAVGARGFNLNRGRVQVFSSATGALLFSRQGTGFNDDYGWAVAQVGDADGDGIRDLAVAAPRHTGNDLGRVEILSLDDFSVLSVYSGGVGSEFGAALDSAGDVDGDGIEDLIVGGPEPGSNGLPVVDPGPGFIRMISIGTGTTLWQQSGAVVGDRFGRTVSAGRDVNGDGVPDVATGAPLSSPLGKFAGEARVYSGDTGELLSLRFGVEVQNRFGKIVDLLGDVDGDGRDDWAVGAVDARGLGTETGFVRVHSGRDSSLLGHIAGDSPFSRLGKTVAWLGRLEADGPPALVVGAPGDDGKTRVYTLEYPDYPWRTTSGGLAGARGIPRLAGRGQLFPGGTAELVLSDGRPDSPATLFLSRMPANTPYQGGVAVPALKSDLVSTVLDATGSFVHEVDWPLGLGSGTVLYFQWWLVDDVGPEGYSSSDGLRVEVPGAGLTVEGWAPDSLAPGF